MRIILLALMSALLFSSASYCASGANSNINLPTYYPSPFGAYEQLRLVPRATINTVSCDSGTMYAKSPDGATQYCMNGIWGAIPGPWVQALDAGRDYWGQPVDQYYLNTLYNPSTRYATHNGYVGINTREPHGLLHIATSDVGTPSMVKIENYQYNAIYNDSSPGPGSNITFWGPWAGVGPRNEYLSIRVIYENQTVPYRKAHIRIYNVDGVNDAYGSERIRILGNGYFGLMDVSPTAVLTFSSRGIFTPPGIQNDILKIGTNADNDGDIMTIDRLGNVGINQTSPTQRLEVNGNIKATALILASDAALKEDIEPVDHALDKIARLQGVSFTRQNEQAAGTTTPEHMGVLAQNVEQVFPDAVYGRHNEKAVDYLSLVAPLIESVKELKAANETLHAEFTTQERLIKKQAQQIKTLKKKAIQK